MPSTCRIGVVERQSEVFVNQPSHRDISRHSLDLVALEHKPDLGPEHLVGRVGRVAAHPPEEHKRLQPDSVAIGSVAYLRSAWVIPRGGSRRGDPSSWVTRGAVGAIIQRIWLKWVSDHVARGGQESIPGKAQEGVPMASVLDSVLVGVGADHE